MKTTCKACEATYSIPDQALELGRFGFQCRRCENRILVEDPPDLLSTPSLSHTRSESSLLFTVQSVWRAIAEEEDTSSSISMSKSPEDSGLLDLRRAQAAYESELGNPRQASASGAFIRADTDLMEPISLPQRPTPSRDKRLLYGVLGATGGAAFAIVVLLALVLKRDATANSLLAVEPVDPLPGVSAQEVLPVAEPEPLPVLASEAPAPEPPAAVAPAPAAVAVVPPETTAPAARTRKVTRRTGKNRAQPTPRRDERGAVDEFTCIMESYALDGCDQYRPPETKPPATAGESAPVRPARLTRNTILNTMKRASSAVKGCGDRYGKGHVKVRVKVTPAGEVSSVEVLESPDAGLGKCVAEAVEALSFPATVSAGSFAYLFPIR